MAGKRREQTGAFMYEPTRPPTIPPGQTIDDWRHNRPRRRRQQGWRIGSTPLLGQLRRRIPRHRGGQR